MYYVCVPRWLGVGGGGGCHGRGSVFRPVSVCNAHRGAAHV